MNPKRNLKQAISCLCFFGYIYILSRAFWLVVYGWLVSELWLNLRYHQKKH